MTVRIDADQAEKSRLFVELLEDVKVFLLALEENGLTVDITDPHTANQLIEAKSNLEKWVEGEEDDEEV